MYFKIPEPDPVSTGVGKWFCLRINCEAAFLLLCGRVAFLFEVQDKWHLKKEALHDYCSDTL